jgi:polysaccharide biosynthesis protein PslG
VTLRAILLAVVSATSSVAGESVGVSTHTLDVAQVERYASLGVRVVRVDLPWSHVVHHDGDAWGQYDKWIAALQRHSLTPLLILQWDGEGHVATAAALAEFARFAGAAARRYPAAMFELLNEPNLRGEAWPYVEPEDYARVAAVLRAAIRASAPSAQVIGPALGGGTLDAAWLSRAFAAGLLDHVDAVSVHPYAAGSPDGAPAYYDRVRALMGRAERPVVVSEWGFLVPEKEQAALLARAIRVNADYGIGLTVLYRWSDLSDHEFGLVRQDGTEKLGAAVVRALLTEGK